LGCLGVARQCLHLVGVVDRPGTAGLDQAIDAAPRFVQREGDVAAVAQDVGVDDRRPLRRFAMLAAWRASWWRAGGASGTLPTARAPISHAGRHPAVPARPASAASQAAMTTPHPPASTTSSAALLR